MQHQILQQLAQYENMPEFSAYLALIFNTPTIPLDTRLTAGLKLKNVLKVVWDSLSVPISEYCKSAVLQGLSDQVQMIRKVSGSIITTVVEGGLIERWLEVLPKLLELLDHPQTIHVFIYY